MPRTPEAGWRTKGAVDFNWGLLSPEAGVDLFGASPSNNDGNTSGSGVSFSTVSSVALDADTAALSGSSNSSLFPADHFGASFTGFGKGVIKLSIHIVYAEVVVGFTTHWYQLKKSVAAFSVIFTEVTLSQGSMIGAKRGGRGTIHRADNCCRLFEWRPALATLQNMPIKNYTCTDSTDTKPSPVPFTPLSPACKTIHTSQSSHHPVMICVPLYHIALHVRNQIRKTIPVKADVDGEYSFRVTTDRASRVALSLSGQELFNDLAIPQSTAASSNIGAATTNVATGGDDLLSPSAAAVVLTEARTGSILLAAGELVPLQLRYAVSTHR